jgi:hypothetical protein
VAISYPDDIDIFNEPSSPEFTPLSSAGSGTRAHVAHHRDLGQAVVALQTHAAKRGHDHSGDATNTSKGAKLSQANTHQSPDTDQSSTSLHHTLGTGANQAAPGNHTHDYTALTGTPWRRVTTLPAVNSVPEGTVVYHESTKQVRILRDGRWALSSLGKTPVCRLLQTRSQTISSGTTGTVLEWGQAVEDNFGFFSAGSPSSITVSEPGLYHVTAALQWDQAVVPDTAFAIVLLKGQETPIREQRSLKGNGIQPGFSQTVSVSGYLRVDAVNDVVALRARYNSGGLVGQILSFFDAATKVQSRIDLVYVSP